MWKRETVRYDQAASANLPCVRRPSVTAPLNRNTSTGIPEQIAADQCGRRARLMEIDPLYCDTIVRRFEQVTGEKACLAIAAPALKPSGRGGRPTPQSMAMVRGQSRPGESRGMAAKAAAADPSQAVASPDGPTLSEHTPAVIVETVPDIAASSHPHTSKSRRTRSAKGER